MNLADYLKECEPEVREFTISVGDRMVAFDLRAVDRKELDANYKTRSIRNKQTGEWEKVVDEAKFRDFFLDKCLTGWSGLTFGLAARLCGKKPLNGNRQAETDAELPFDKETARVLLGTVLGLEAQLMAEVIKRADQRDAEDQAAKNA